MPRRLTIAAFVLLFLVLILAALWNVFDWPPPKMILKYGLPPTGGPTGRTMTIEGVEFIELQPGYFRMGSHFLCERGNLLGRVCALLHLRWGEHPKHDSFECPPHWVEIRRAFWIARTEITNVQYERFDSRHDRSYSRGDLDPVANVGHEDAREYCHWLSTRGNLRIRLPSESEWEYACRAGSSGEFCFGDDAGTLHEFAWCRDNEPLSDTRPVATRRPNGWGLFDMHGNLWEWVQDSWHQNYAGAAADGQPWEDISSLDRVIRGGGVGLPATYCRSASRLWMHGLDVQVSYIGFRPAGSSRRRP